MNNENELLKNLCKKLREEVRAPLNICLKVLKEVDLDYDKALVKVRKDYKIDTTKIRSNETYTRGYFNDKGIVYFLGESSISVRSEAFDKLTEIIPNIALSNSDNFNLNNMDKSNYLELERYLDQAMLSLKERVGITGWLKFRNEMNTYYHTVVGNNFYAGAVVHNLPNHFGAEIH